MRAQIFNMFASQQEGERGVARGMVAVDDQRHQGASGGEVSSLNPALKPLEL